MDRRAIEMAAAAFADARRSGRLIDRLPEACRPTTVADAHAIQDATVAALGDSVGAWKVSPPINGDLVRGAILRSRIFDSPARMRAADVPMLGVEAEIAFRFDRDLPPRDRDYAYEDVAGVVTALVAIEVVDSRFQRYKDTPLLDKAADCVSNGGLVRGSLRADWRTFDLSNITASLLVDGKVLVRQAGSHVAGDPLLPAIALANSLRPTGGLRAGIVVTTGTYTGLQFATPGQTVKADFEGFGAAVVTFDGPAVSSV